MRVKILIYIVCIGFLACKPVKHELGYTPSYVSVEQADEDAKLNKIIAPYKTSLDVEMNKVIGKSDMPFPKQLNLPETVLGNLVADLTLEFARTVLKETDFSVLNNGGLRSSLPEGDITLRNVFEIMPFDNEVVILTIKGEELNKLVQYIAGRGGVPVSGMTMVLKKTDAVFNAGEVMINGIPVDAEKNYKVATSDYLATGGDSMNFWSTDGMIKTNKKLRDAIIDFIRFKTDKNEWVHSELDNRIRIVE